MQGALERHHDRQQQMASRAGEPQNDLERPLALQRVSSSPSYHRQREEVVCTGASGERNSTTKQPRQKQSVLLNPFQVTLPKQSVLVNPSQVTLPKQTVVLMPSFMTLTMQS